MKLDNKLVGNLSVGLLQPLAQELKTSSPVETLRLLITAPDRAGTRLVDQQFSEKYGAPLSEVEKLLDDVMAQEEKKKPVERLREVMAKKQEFREKKEQRESGKDYPSMPWSELRGYKTDKAAEERFRRAVQAIMHYNDRTDIQEESRWFLNPAVIVDLVGGRHADIKAYLEAHKEEIDAHHKKCELSAKFNRKPVDIKKRVI